MRHAVLKSGGKPPHSKFAYSTFIPKLFTKNTHKSAASAIFLLVGLPWPARVLISIKIGLSQDCARYMAAVVSVFVTCFNLVHHLHPEDTRPGSVQKMCLTTRRVTE